MILVGFVLQAYLSGVFVMDNMPEYHSKKICILYQIVRTFFRTNKATCLEWLSRIRKMVAEVAIYSGLPALAVRHCHEILRDMKENNNLQVCMVHVYHSTVKHLLFA